MASPLATADPAAAPAMVAEAHLGQGGVLVSWTAPPMQEGVFTIERSHDGGAFVPLASVDPSVLSYLDPAGTLADIYVVRTAGLDGVEFVSNPAMAAVLPCPPVELGDQPPFVITHPGCGVPCLPVGTQSWFPYVAVGLCPLPVGVLFPELAILP